MKNLLFVLFAFVSLSLGAQESSTVTPVSDAGSAVITFESTEVDYGTIEQNSDPHRAFTFTNTGDAPLIITNAKGSCGCTVPSYPKEPIMPGESNEIKVRYDTKRIGSFSKSITLTTNATTESVVLRIKGKVNAAPTEAVPTKEKGEF